MVIIGEGEVASSSVTILHTPNHYYVVPGVCVLNVKQN